MMAEWPSCVIEFKKQLELHQTIIREEPHLSPSPTRDQIFRYTNSVKDWESHVASISYMERSKVPGFIVYVDWKNGYKSVHHSTEVYAKCPQKMIEFFENHIQFTQITADD
ncbi:hypothetical protein EDC96DRAFT_69520 [Choanephora cucurbitarum]|nr:hypothetical protein EDC96DRAFT_69520 [Choanephora cucurbitarum]